MSETDKNFRKYNLVSSWKPKFKCAICSKSDLGLNQTYRPFILECFHDVCEKCLCQWKTPFTLTCKICHHKTKIDSSQMMREKVEPSHFLRGLIFYMQKKMCYDLERLRPNDDYNLQNFNLTSNIDENNCYECDECNANTQYYCVQCSVPLCSDCYEIMHKIGKVLRKHNLVKIKPRGLIIDKKNPHVCEKHNVICEQFCKICQKITCDQCIPLNHSRHQHLVISLLDENSTYIKQLNDLISTVDTLKKKYEISFENKDTVFNTYEKYALESVGKVSEYFCKLHNILQFSERNALLEIKKNVIEFKSKLDMTENRALKTVETLEDMISSLQGVAKQSGRMHLKKVVDTANKYLDYTPEPKSLRKIDKNPFIFEEIEDLEKLLKEICPYKLNEEIISDKPLQLRENQTGTKKKSENPLLSSILNMSIKSQPRTSQAVLNTKLTLTTNTSSGFNSHNKIKIKNVRISFFNNPLDFYVQFNSFQAIEKDLENECETEGELNSTPDEIRIENIYLAKSKNVWRRGKILEEIKPLTYQIRLIDTGEVTIATKEQITSISKELQEKENGARKCCIYNIKGAKGLQEVWCDDVQRLAVDLILNKTVTLLIVKETEEILYVDIISQNIYPTSLRASLLFTDMAKIVRITDNTIKKNLNFYTMYKKRDLLPLINDVFPSSAITELSEFRINPLNIVSPSEFYVISYNSVTQIKKLHFELNNFYNKNCVQVYSPRINMKCAVKICGNWYRCKIIKVHDRLNVDVFLVDQGRSEKVHYFQLSFLDKSHSANGEYSFRCNLIDIEPLASNNYNWTTEALNEFQRIMKHSHLKVFVHLINNFDHKVTLKIVQKNQEINVNALMVRYGHAASMGIESINVELSKLKTPLQSPEKEKPIKEKRSSCNSSIIEQNNDADETIENVIIPDLDTLPSSSSVFSTENTLQLNHLSFEREEIVITHIVSPGEFFLYLKKYEEGIIKLHSYIQKQQEEILNDNPESQIKHNWKLNEDCLAFVETIKTKNKEWYRAIITDIENQDEQHCTKYTIYLRDNGSKIYNLTKKDLSIIDISDARLCDGITKCHLACVKPTGGVDFWSRGAIDSLKRNVLRYEKIYGTIQGEHVNNSIPIVLWGLSTEIEDALAPTLYKYVNINKTLSNIGFVELTEKFDRNKQIMKLKNVSNQNEFKNLDTIMKYIEESLCNVHIKKSSISEDEFNIINNNAENFDGWLLTTIDKTTFTAYPTYVDDNAYIYLHDALKENYLEKIKKYINNKYKNVEIKSENKSIDWKIGQPCVARYHSDLLYYRGEVMKILENGTIKVCFIDYGNVEECTNEELINEICLPKIPRQAVKYKLYGVKPKTIDGIWSEKILDMIHFAIVMKMCRIVVVKHIDDNIDDTIKECSIEFDGNDLATVLLEKKLVIPTEKSLLPNLTCFEDDDFIGENSEDNSIMPDDNDDPNNEHNDEDGDKTKNNENDESRNKNKNSIIQENKIDNEVKDYSESSDDENEIWHKKQKQKCNTNNIEEVNTMNFDTYENMFQKEELNRFYNSIITESQSSDEVDINYDYTYQSWHRNEIFKSNDNQSKERYEISNDSTSSIETFDPLDTSTFIPPFDGIENFQFYKLPHGVKEFYSEVHYIENLTKIYISPSITDLHKQFLLMMKCIQAYIKSTGSHLIQAEIKKPCLALFNEDDLYYRGLIRNVHQESKTAEILYVDFFNTDSVSFKNIRKCPDQFLEYPLRLMPIKLYDTKPNPRWRESDIKSILNEALIEKKNYTEIIKPGRISEVQFYVSQSDRTLLLKDLYGKKIFLRN